MRLGEFDIDVVTDGTFWLDAGTMFGIIPKTLWERQVEVDDRNRMEISMNVLLVRGPQCCALVDAGMGRNYDDKTRDILGLRPGVDLLASLAARGVEPEDVDLVAPTHLHLDHAGWCTRPGENGACVPTFPNAQYVVQAAELEDARAPNDLTKGSFVPSHFEPLVEAGRLETVDGDAEIAPGIRVRRTGGHARGHQAVLIESAGGTCLFIGDVAPTALHMRPTYGTAYDSFPLDLVEQKKALLGEAAAKGWVVAFPHDRHTPLARIAHDGKGRLVAEGL